MDAAFALDRLDQDGSRLRTHEVLRGLEVAKGRVEEAADNGAEALLHRGLARRGETAVGAAVEGSREAQDLGLLRPVLRMGVLAGKLYSRLYALGAGVAEEDPVEVRSTGQEISNLGLDRYLIQVGAVDQPLSLLLYGLHDRGVAVPQRVRRDAGDEVEVTVALVVEEPAPAPARRGYSQTLVGLHHGFHATTPSDINVPTSSPASAAASAPSLLPFMILALTPPRAASAAARSLGTIPPAASPEATYSSHSSGASDPTGAPSLSKPSTSVSKKRCSAPSPKASAAAAASALTLYAPSGPSPRGATTGTNPPAQRACIRSGSTSLTSPTRPSSGMGSTRSVGPSLPANTISAISRVSESVTRSPSRKRVGIPSASSIRVSWRPPPCASAISLPDPRMPGRSSSAPPTRAPPPNLITTGFTCGSSR